MASKDTAPKRGFLFYNTLRWANVLLILITLVSYLSPYISPVLFWPISFLGLAYPWLLLANVLCVMGWLILKNRYFLFSLGCIIIGWGHLSNFIGFSSTGDTLNTSAVKVMTYNIQALNRLRTGNRERSLKKRAAFLRFMKENNPIDILCTQETVGRNRTYLSEHLGLPHYTNGVGKQATIFSKHPIRKAGQIDFGTSANSCVWADININGQMARVYSIHLKSNQVSDAADKIMEQGDLQEKETWLGIRAMLAKVRHAAPKRAQQAELIAPHIAQSPYPVIVCGDFNDTPQSYTYRLLSRNLQDAFAKQSFGFGTTYAGSIPALRIDYILTDKRIKVFNHKILKKETFSDHYPVVSDIEIAE